MSAGTVYEIVGYVASALVVISLAMTSVLRLRIINLIGAIVFVVYGVLIGAVPIVIVNVAIVGINAYFLLQAARSSEYFQVLEASESSPYVLEFLRFHRDEIRRFQPDADPRLGPDRLVLLVLRDLIPAGLFIGAPAGDGTLRVELDFVTPAYRDFAVARFLFRDRASLFRERGFVRLVTSSGTPDHARYLERIGFRSIDGGYAFDL